MQIDKDLDVLKETLDRWKVDYTDRMVEQAGKFIRLLKQWSERVNLVSAQDVDRVMEAHFLESLFLLSAFELTAGATLVDIGTGAGFPGIPIKLFRPDIITHLVEAKEKKAVFLERVKENLGLSGLKVINNRCEAFGTQLKGRFDYLTIRALGDFDFINEHCVPLIKSGGTLFLFKGEVDVKRLANELQGTPSLGLERVVSIPSVRERKVIVAVEKVG